MGLEDVTGNFLAAAGLTSGTLQRGQDLIYTVNGGGQLMSHSNTLTSESHGIDGLSVTAATTATTQGSPASVTITVANDTDKIKKAITDFIEAYNRVQSVIDTQTTSSTDAKGVVTAGILASDGDADEIAATLRRSAYSQITGLSGVLDHLADIGITTSGDNNNITLSDADALTAALTSKLESVKQLFTDATSGIAVNLAAYLERTIGDNGSLVAKQDGLTKQASGIDTQIADLEKIVQANRARMVEQFTAMETAQQRLNQQLQFLAQQNFGN